MPSPRWLMLLAACTLLPFGGVAAQGARATVDSVVFERLTSYGPQAPRRRGAPVRGEAPLVAFASRAAAGPNGRVYLLDGGDQAILVYAADGTPERVIGRPGAGPGEFGRAHTLDVAPDGRLAVLDDAPRRVSVFNAKDSLLTTVVLGGSAAFSVVVGVRGFDLLHEFGRSTATALGFYPMTKGAAPQAYLTPTARDRAFAKGGSPGLLARGIGDELLYFSGAPGTWAVIDSERRVGKRRGVDLFPTADFVARNEGNGSPLLYTPAAVVGGGVVSGNRIFVVYLLTSFANSTTKRIDHSWGVALFDRDGTLRARGTLPATWGTPGRIRPGHGDTILIPFSEPEPHVRAVRLRVVPRER